MATGRSMQLTKQIGEYLVAAELCRRGLIATTFTGNVPEFDILAINPERETIRIQVKTIRGGNWQFDVRTFVNVETKREINLPNPDLICIFVRLICRGQDEFYVFQLKDLQAVICNRYRTWLEAKKGIRSRNPNSTHASARPKDLVKFRDEWDLVAPFGPFGSSRRADHPASGDNLSGRLRHEI